MPDDVKAMPDSTEATAAMERLRKHREVHGTERYAESPYYVPEHAPPWRWDYQMELADIRTIADARLSEHDTGPITDEVLRECGFKFSCGEWYVVTPAIVLTLDHKHDGSWLPRLEDESDDSLIYLPHIRTAGALRRLVAVLKGGE